MGAWVFAWALLWLWVVHGGVDGCMGAVVAVGGAVGCAVHGGSNGCMGFVVAVGGASGCGWCMGVCVVA